MFDLLFNSPHMRHENHQTMKIKILLSYLPILLAVMCFAFTNTNPSAKVKIDKMEHDFGVIEQGVPKTATFTLTNEADVPMILTKVKGSCGCTATAYDKEPIAPGAKTEIEATYNAKSVGNFTKTVTVSTNLDDKPIVLTIRGNVKSV